MKWSPRSQVSPRRWLRLQQTRLAWWLTDRAPHLPQDEVTALRWLVAALTLIVLLETSLLILQATTGVAPH